MRHALAFQTPVLPGELAGDEQRSITVALPPETPQGFILLHFERELLAGGMLRDSCQFSQRDI